MTANPEEVIRQHFLRVLVEQYGYDLTQIEQECRTQDGNKTFYADLVVWASAAEKNVDTVRSPLIVVECKSDSIEIQERNYYQGESYTRASGCEFFVATNARHTSVFRLMPGHPGGFVAIDEIPKASDWDSVKRLKEIKESLKILSQMSITENNKLTYIIGNNGSGKSTALALHAEKKSEVYPVVVIATGLSDRFVYRSEQRKNKSGGSYTYLGNRTVGNGLHINTLSSNSVLYYGKLLRGNREQLFLTFLEKIGFQPVVNIKSTRKKRSDKDYVEFDMMPFDQVFLGKYAKLLDDKTKPFDAIFTRGGSELPLGALSSGEQTIISTALKLLSEFEPNTTYYIDEPELSLHVEWQLQWPELFHNLLSNVENFKLYIATHSPIIIARALQLGAQCYNLKNSGIERIEEENVNVERIIFNEFHTFTSDNRHIYSEFSKILGELVERLNSKESRVVTKAHADAALMSISEKIDSVIAVGQDKALLEKTFQDFSRAVDEVISINVR